MVGLLIGEIHFDLADHVNERKIGFMVIEIPLRDDLEEEVIVILAE